MGCVVSAHDEETINEVVEERRLTFGDKLNLRPVCFQDRAESIMMGVLPLAAAFDKFDADGSAGLSVTELLEASLLDVLHRPDLRPVTSWAGCLLAVATDIAKGMAYLHYHDVLHRDLKPANILLSEHWVAKVAGSPPCLRALRGPAHRFCPCLTLPLHADFGSGR